MEFTQSYAYQQRAFRAFLKLTPQIYQIQGTDDPEWKMETNCAYLWEALQSSPFDIDELDLLEMTFYDDIPNADLVNWIDAWYFDRHYICSA